MAGSLFPNQQEAKKAGYFSRRNRTTEAMNAAREHFVTRRLTRIQHPRPEEWPARGIDKRKLKQAE